jgi:F-type H+-transporting ATPase subunit alpha
MNAPDISNLFQQLDASLAAFSPESGAQGRAGLIRSAKDGILHIGGLPGLGMAEVVRVPDAGGAEALVMQLDGDDAYAVLLTPGLTVVEGQTVEPTGRVLGVEISEAVLGRVVDALGRPIDGGGRRARLRRGGR